MLHRHALAAALAVVAVLAGLASPATAAAATGAPPPGSKYVALGDSFASGPGLLPFDMTRPDGPPCARSTQNYAHQVTKKLGLVLDDRTCGGAGIAEVRSQLGAVTTDTALVTITVGGNDLDLFVDLLRYSCAHDPGPMAALPDFMRDLACKQRVDQARSEAKLAGVQSGLESLVSDIRRLAPQARVVLTDYVGLLPKTGIGCAVEPLTTEEARFVLAQDRRFSLAVKNAAQATGASFIDISKDSRFHDVCSADPWANGYRFGNFFEVGLTGYHPRLVAHQAVTDRVVKLLRCTSAHRQP